MLISLHIADQLTSQWSWRTPNIVDIWIGPESTVTNPKVDRHMKGPNLTLLFEPRPFQTIFSACGRPVHFKYSCG